ncbi:MAG: AAA family ATPase [Gammaproteobacteria bacterium]|nr:AAA family ATPase [Gammaproteobacteria bacterium]
MQARDYFPLGLAKGSAFCNRVQEAELLLDNMQYSKHTLLMAPRRYGKSSLAFRAIELSGLPFAEVDFYMARNEAVIANYILNSVIELIGRSLGPVEKLVTLIKRYVKNLHPKINIAANNIKLELVAEQDSDPATNVKEALLLLESLLEAKKQRAVLFFDEFQNVGIIAKGLGIEAAIRHAAQKMQYLTIIFSGSNRKLLQTMFEDDTRPLYKLCWKLTLERIAADHYAKHITKAAKSSWRQAISENALHEIMQLTERHPYYVNKLCDRIWAYCKKPATEKDVVSMWQDILVAEKRDAISEIGSLAVGQKNVLLYIAKGNTQGLTGKQAILNMQMTSSSIVTALESLEGKDVVWKADGHYNIINPVVKFYVLKYEQN